MIFHSIFILLIAKENEWIWHTFNPSNVSRLLPSKAQGRKDL